MRVVVLLALLFSAASASAALPALVVTHQGRLVGTDGQALAGPVKLTFGLHTLFATGLGDELVWTDTYTGVPLDGSGSYAVLLGDTSSGQGHTGLSPDLFAGDRWLSVSVNDVPLTPWLRLGTVPLASHANVAEEATHAAEAAHAASATNADHLENKTLSDLDGRWAGLAPTAAQAGSLWVTGDVTAGHLKGDGSAITNLSAAALTGLVPSASLPQGTALLAGPQQFTGTHTFQQLNVSGNLTVGAGGKLSGDGSGLTNVPWSGLADGVLPDARLGGTYGGALTFTGPVTFTGNVSGAGQAKTGTGDPAANTCDAARAGTLYVNTANGQLFYCSGSVWRKSNFRAAQLALSISTVVFGTVTTASGTASVVVSNPSDDTVTGLAVAVAGTGFSHNTTDSTCTTTLAPGAACSVALTLAGTGGAGARTGTVTVSSTNAASVSAALSGAVDPRSFLLHLDSNAVDALGNFTFTTTPIAQWDTTNFFGSSGAALIGNVYYQGPSTHALSTTAHTAWSLATSNPDWEFTWQYRHTGDTGYGTVVASNNTTWSGSVNTYINQNPSNSSQLPAGWMISVYWGASYVQFNSAGGIVTWTYPGYHNDFKALTMKRVGTNLEFLINGVSQGLRTAPTLASTTATPLYIMGSPDYANAGYTNPSPAMRAQLDELKFHSP